MTAYRQAATGEAVGAVLGSATIPVGSFDQPEADDVVRVWSLGSPTAPRPWAERTLTTPTSKTPTSKTPTSKTIVANLTFLGPSRMLAVLTAIGDLRVLDAGRAANRPGHPSPVGPRLIR